MCGPTVLWDLMILDFAYLLTLVGGTLVLRARQSGPTTWVFFGILSFIVGTALFYATYQAQTLEAVAPPAGAFATAASLRAC